jgi:hypothetical protein
MNRKQLESPWLGAEALPAGLAEINRTIQSWSEARSRKTRLSLEKSQPVGWIAAAARWMHKAVRPS